jgi:hypothetical protein
MEESSLSLKTFQQNLTCDGNESAQHRVDDVCDQVLLGDKVSA